MYPVLLHVGSWELRSYGVFVAIAVFVGIWWSAREGERRGFSRQAIYDFATVTLIAGFIGARLYYVLLSEPQTYLQNPWEILAVWHGGLAMQGGLLAGLLAGVWYVRRHGLPFWRFSDAVIPGLILGQTVGQIACLLNGDTYGKPTTLPWAIVFTNPEAMAPLGIPLHPIQVYELLAYLVVFVVVHRVARRTNRPGAVTVTYAVLYGVARFAMEFFRAEPPTIAGIVVPQAMSALLAAAGVVTVLVLRSKVWTRQAPPVLGASAENRAA